MWNGKRIISEGFLNWRRLSLPEGIPLALDLLEDPKRIPYVGNTRCEDSFPHFADFIVPLGPYDEFSQAQILRYTSFLKDLQKEKGSHSKDYINLTPINLGRIQSSLEGQFLNIATHLGPTTYALSTWLNRTDEGAKYSASFYEDLSPFHKKMRLKHLGY